jgi:hypothetical protein
VTTAYALYRALLGFACQAPVFALYAIDHGAGYRDLALWTLAFAAAKALGDVPAGVFADRLGRRPALLARAGLELVSVAVLFDHRFLLSAVLAGAGCAFSSGAEAAFVYEHRPRDFARVFGRAASWSAISAAAAAVIGGALALVDVELVFGLRLLALLGAGAVALALPEPPRRFAADVAPSRPRLARLLAFAGTLGAVQVAALQLQPPFLREAGVPLAALGGLYVAFQAASALGARLAWRLPRALPAVAVLSALGFAAMAALGGLPAVGGVFLLKFAHGVSLPLFGRALNERAPGGARATALSLRSLFEGAALLLAAPALGWAADTFSLRAAFGLAAILVAPSLLLSEAVPCAVSSGSPARA